MLNPLGKIVLENRTLTQSQSIPSQITYKYQGQKSIYNGQTWWTKCKQWINININNNRINQHQLPPDVVHENIQHHLYGSPPQKSMT